MKRNSYISMLFFAAVIGFSACQNQPSKEQGKMKTLEDAETEFLQTLDKTDTSTVITQSKLFMEKLQAGNVEEAIDMLYILNNGLLLDTLTAEQKESYAKRFRTYPIRSYQLDYYSFSTQGNNDVKFSYDFTGKGARMNLMLNPVKIDTTWYLTMKGKFNYSQEQAKPRHPHSPAPLEIIKKEK